MTDTVQKEHHGSRRFIKGVHRAFFTPVEPEDVVISASPQSTTVPAQPVTPSPLPSQTVPITAPAPVVSSAPESRPPRKKPPAKFIFFMLLGILMAGIGVYGYMYWNSQQQLNQLRVTSPQAFTDMETAALVKQVARHMDLPDETPVIRTLSGVDATLRKEPFYAKAKDGDKVLVFSQRAILYDPVADKIIEVGSILQNTPAPKASTEQVATKSAVSK